jgi:hypothetical protein
MTSSVEHDVLDIENDPEIRIISASPNRSSKLELGPWATWLETYLPDVLHSEVPRFGWIAWERWTDTLSHGSWVLGNPLSALQAPDRRGEIAGCAARRATGSCGDAAPAKPAIKGVKLSEGGSRARDARAARRCARGHRAEYAAIRRQRAIDSW